MIGTSRKRIYRLWGGDLPGDKGNPLTVRTIGVYLHHMRTRIAQVGFRDMMTYSLSGRVQIDETFVATKRKNNTGRVKRGRKFTLVNSYFLVVIMCRRCCHFEVLGMWDDILKKLVVVRIPDRKGATMVPIIKYFCVQGIRIHTDGWDGYLTLASEGYQHLVVVHK